VVPADVLAATADELRSEVMAAGSLGLDVAALDERRRAVLDTLDDVVVDAGRPRPAGAIDELGDHPFVDAVREGGFAPPGTDGVDRGVLRELLRRRLLVERDGVVFHPEAIEAAGSVAAHLLAEHPDGFTVGQFRDEIGVTRKHAVPLLAELDARAVTRRRDDLRIGGPRLPAR
jgi:selenocysteine-specific elongation factor